MNRLHKLFLGFVVAVPLLFVAPSASNADYRDGYYRGRNGYQRYYRPDYYGRRYYQGRRYYNDPYGRYGQRGYYATPRYRYNYNYGGYGGSVRVGPLYFRWR